MEMNEGFRDFLDNQATPVSTGRWASANSVNVSAAMDKVQLNARAAYVALL